MSLYETKLTGILLYMGRKDISYKGEKQKYEKSEGKKSWQNKHQIRSTGMDPFTNGKTYI